MTIEVCRAAVRCRSTSRLEVVGAGGQSQLHRPAVGLVAVQVRRSRHGWPQGDRQHAGHGRIEGAAMAHPFEPHRPAAPGSRSCGSSSPAGLSSTRKPTGARVVRMARWRMGKDLGSLS
jgi:hypothetical protein